MLNLGRDPGVEQSNTGILIQGNGESFWVSADGLNFETLEGELVSGFTVKEGEDGSYALVAGTASSKPGISYGNFQGAASRALMAKWIKKDNGKRHLELFTSGLDLYVVEENQEAQLFSGEQLLADALDGDPVSLIALAAGQVLYASSFELKAPKGRTRSGLLGGNTRATEYPVENSDGSLTLYEWFDKSPSKVDDVQHGEVLFSGFDGTDHFYGVPETWTINGTGNYTLDPTKKTINRLYAGTRFQAIEDQGQISLTYLDDEDDIMVDVALDPAQLGDTLEQFENGYLLTSTLHNHETGGSYKRLYAYHVATQTYKDLDLNVIDTSIIANGRLAYISYLDSGDGNWELDLGYINLSNLSTETIAFHTDIYALAKPFHDLKILSFNGSKIAYIDTASQVSYLESGIIASDILAIVPYNDVQENIVGFIYEELQTSGNINNRKFIALEWDATTGVFHDGFHFLTQDSFYRNRYRR
jgi:hypothetical protein